MLLISYRARRNEGNVQKVLPPHIGHHRSRHLTYISTCKNEEIENLPSKPLVRAGVATKPLSSSLAC